MSALCAICAADVPEVGLLCVRCIGRLRRNLADLSALWPLVEEVMQPGQGSGGSNKPGSRPPANLDAIDATDPRGVLAATLGGWSRIVVEERRLSTCPDSIDAAIVLLTAHADWIAAQPWCVEAAAEIRQAARTVRGVCRDWPDPPLGTCRALDPMGERDYCGGPVRLVDDAAVCGRCGDRWASPDMVHIGRVVPLRLWDTCAAVAELLDIPARTVQHWAATGKVRRDSFGRVLHSEVMGYAATRREPGCLPEVDAI